MNIEARLKHYRLNSHEYELIKSLLGREPKGVEWALFSALWSEHCSYKSSKIHLRKFSYRNSRTMESEGENAGVIDLGQGEKVAFKMESHNHPSFIEPYQGAATGVGGILRDIFTMGARPIALADFLCFGEVTAPRMPSIIEGVVKGIGGYGNCVGVPTVTGQTEFHSSYNTNVLVNAMAVGLIEEGMPMALSGAQGPGNLVVYVGAKTGRDGVHGASMASESFSDDTESKKPNVQIGDPFFEKLLIEACLEALQTKKIVAMQDMGAAGLTSSSFEMAAKGGVGLTLDLDKVPVRDSSISAEEILLSESQERMLLILKPEDFDEVAAIFNRWDLDAAVLGQVTQDPHIVISHHGEVLTKIKPSLIVDSAPKYDRAVGLPRKQGRNLPLSEMSNTFGYVERVFAELSKSPVFQSKKEIYRQYDQRVGGRTVRDCSESLAILRLPSGRALSVAVGCRPAFMRMNPELGAFDAVFYPALQMAVKGFLPMAVTDCLNFGNPEKAGIMAEFVTSVECIAKAAKTLDAPVVSGNVSFYNETFGQNITSTPATGMIGLSEIDLNAIPRDHFVGEGRLLWVRCPQVKAVAQISEALKVESIYEGQFDCETGYHFLKTIREMILENCDTIATTRSVGVGGLFWTLMKMCTQDLGFEITEKVLESFESPTELMSEDMYSAVFVVKASEVNAVSAQLKEKFSNVGLSVTERVGASSATEALQIMNIGEVQRKHVTWGREFAISTAEWCDNRKEVSWI